MKIEFTTINIAGFVIAFVLLFLLFSVVDYFIDFEPEYIYSVFLFIAPFYLLFRGRLSLALSDGYLCMKWLKKPSFGYYKDRRIYYKDVLRWKYVEGYRGPDALVFILKSGEKLKIRPSIFNFKNIEDHFLKEFTRRIADYHSNCSRKELIEQLMSSVYLQKLEKKIARWNSFIWINLATMFLFFGLGIFVEEESNSVYWVVFCFSILVFLIVNTRLSLLKNELRDTTKLG